MELKANSEIFDEIIKLKNNLQLIAARYQNDSTVDFNTMLTHNQLVNETLEKLVSTKFTLAQLRTETPEYLSKLYLWK